MQTSVLAALAALVLASPAFAQATVSYSYYTATGPADTSWVSVSGYDSIIAGNPGGSTMTSFGSVDWLAMPAGSVFTTANGVNVYYSAPNQAWATTYNAFYPGGPALLNDGAYSSSLQANSVDYAIDIIGLTVGKDYKVQFVLADNRDDVGHATILAKGANVTGDSARYRYSYTDGQFAVITATFTATATTASFQPGQRWGDDVPDGTFLSAIQVLAAASNDYESWKSANSVVGGENDDDDNDGVTNREEYAFGLVPTSGASLNPITAPLDKTAKTFSYTRRDMSKTDLTYSVWFSTNLSTWLEDSGTTEGTPVLSGEVETVQVTLSNLPGDPLPDKIFIQVRAN